MKKSIIVIATFILLLSGCSQFNSDTMVCSLKEQDNTNLEYEIKYTDEDIDSIAIIKTIDFSTFDDANFNNQVKTIKSDAKAINKTKGLEETVSVDQKIITVTIKVDINDYDAVKDSKYIFNVYFKESNIEGIYSIREKLTNSGYQCDEITEK